MAAEKMLVDEVLGSETEEDPYATDAFSDFDPEKGEPKRNKKVLRKKKQSQPEWKVKEGESSKIESPKVESSKVEPSKSGKKKVSKASSKEDKKKLADLVKEEEIIYNIQHELYSNGPAVAAAWQPKWTKLVNILSLVILI